MVGLDKDIVGHPEANSARWALVRDENGHVTVGADSSTGTRGTGDVRGIIWSTALVGYLLAAAVSSLRVNGDLGVEVELPGALALGVLVAVPRPWRCRPTQTDPVYSNQQPRLQSREPSASAYLASP